MSSNGNGRLEPRQLRFVEEFLLDCNATQAAIRAGYSHRTARSIASENLTKPNIQQAIKARLAKLTETTDVTVERVLLELKRMAYVDVGEAYDEDECLKPFKDMPEDVRRAIVGVQVDEIWEWIGEGEDRERVQVGVRKKVKFADKRGSNELLGKYLKMFVERHEFGLTDDLLEALQAGRQRVANAR